MFLFSLPLILTLFSTVTLGAQCGPDEYFRRAHNRKAYHRADGSFVEATTVKSSCIKKQSSYDKWIGRLADGAAPNWPHKREKSQRWSDEERERVLEALSELPEQLANLSNVKIYRYIQSKDFPNPATRTQNIIVLYDTAFDRNRRLARILAHELAHELYEKIEFTSLATDFRRVSGWKPKIDGRNYIWIPERSGLVAPDSKVDMTEDFANNIEYFLFDRPTLKKVSPEIHDWINKTWGDTFKFRKVDHD